MPWWMEWVIIIVGALLVTFLLRTFVFEMVRVDGESMQSTLYSGERVYMEKLVLRFTGPERGDIVECYYRDYDEATYGKRTYTYIKRIVGLPGETVKLDGKDIYINGVLLDEPYLDDYQDSVYMGEKEIVVPEGEYFVLGDNRANSSDSRRESVGCIPRKDILGKGLFRLWPLDKISALK